MRAYVISRLGQAAFVVTGITITVFVVLRLTAGDPARIRGQIFTQEDVLQTYREEFGTDRSLLEQLWSFLSGVIRGDLGTSFRFNDPVIGLVAEAVPQTLQIAALALAMSVVAALLLGVAAARRPNGLWDRVASVVTVLGQSAPLFWVGLLLIWIFALRLSWLPSGGYSGVRSLILPAIAIAFMILPSQLRVLLTSMRTELRRGWVTTARAFGLSERRISYHYALRNAVLPMLTVVGNDMGLLLAGAIVAEVVFNYPGVGSLVMTAIGSRDFPLIQGVTIVAASLFVIINLVIDLLYVAIDPRVRLES